MADMALATNPRALPVADVYAACKSFVLAYALPALNPDCIIIQGWRNGMPLDTNDYAVINVVSDTQHGTTLETFSAGNPDKAVPGILTVKSLVELNVQIDFYAEGDRARQRARHLAIAARSSLGVEFFNRHGLSCLYADDGKDILFVDDARQLVRRWMTILHISVNQGISVDYPYFDSALASRVENADAHHPPRADTTDQEK